jgi:CDP-diacylglycerol--serine O-phosphatidyltransferase
MKLQKYFYPNLITLASLFCAFYSISETFNEHYIGSVYLILLSALFDTLDGKVARLLHSTSDFGKELDSLVDTISFGIAPSFLIYNYLHLYNFQFGFILPFIYTACVILRLAKFNILPLNISKRYFIGLPCPAAAISIVSVIYLQIKNYEIDNIWLILIILILSLLMISNIYYYSLKNLEIFIRRKKAIVTISILLLILIIAIKEPIVMFILISLYIVSGPARSALIKLHAHYSHIS